MHIEQVKKREVKRVHIQQLLKQGLAQCPEKATYALN